MMVNTENPKEHYLIASDLEDPKVPTYHMKYLQL
jgi:hypothetical protein